MKKLLKVTSVAAFAFFLSSSIHASEASKLDVKKACSVESNGIENVLSTAVKYNTIAKKQGLEFMRLGMKTSQYIKGVEEAIKSSSKTVDIVNKKKKKTGTVSTSYAAWRACSFAIRSLQQNNEAEATWAMAVPGNGFKY